MRKVFFSTLVLVFCMLVAASPAAAAGATEAQTADIVADEAPATELCLEDAAPQGVAEITAEVFADSLLPAPTPMWNCNGCVEPSPCQSHAQCGYPQGRCIDNSCRCICDPGA